MNNDPAVFGALYLLLDYPVLHTLSREHTSSTKLDGRACHHLYKEHWSKIDWQKVSAQELGLMTLLDLEVKASAPLP
jgi:hypothetical protein